MVLFPPFHCHNMNMFNPFCCIMLFCLEPQHWLLAWHIWKTVLGCGPHTHNYTHLISLFLPLSRVNCCRSGWQMKTTTFIHQLWILYLINTWEKQQHHCTWDWSNNEVY
jgi:hypothetical protein